MHIAALFLLASIAAPPPPQTAPAAAARIDHAALHVADLDASARFYADLFNLTEIPAPVPERRWFDLGGGIALHLIAGRSAPVADDRSVHLALTIADLAPLIATLDARGIAYTDFAGQARTISTGRGDGVHQIFLRDPDGYWLEINDTRAQPAKPEDRR